MRYTQIDSTVQYGTVLVITQQQYGCSLVFEAITVILNNPMNCHPVTDGALQAQLEVLSEPSKGFNNADIY